jgi:putative DNA primase/helicase
VTVANSSLMTANGSKLEIFGDLKRRSLRSRMDARTEQPETREFRGGDPVDRARSERIRFVRDALIVLLGFYTAGKPVPASVKPLGSFEQWSSLIRNCLIWLGEPDPCETMDRTRVDDTQRRALAEVIYWWEAVIGRDAVTARSAIEYANERIPPATGIDSNGPWPYRNPEFRDALMTVAAESGSRDISVKRLGKWLAGSGAKIIDGQRIVADRDDGHGTIRWKLETVG